MDSDISDVLRDGLNGVLALAVPAFLTVAGILLKKLISALEKKNDIARDAEKDDRIKETVEQVVSYVSAKYVDRWKQKEIFGEDHEKEAVRLAVDNVKALLSKDDEYYIMRVYGDVDLWLKTRIELEVARQKDGHYEARHSL